DVGVGGAVGAAAVTSTGAVAAVPAGGAGAGSGVAGRLPSADELEGDPEYGDVEPLVATGTVSGGARTTLVAPPRRRRRHWPWAVPLVVLLGLLAVTFVLIGQLSEEQFLADPTSGVGSAA